MKMTNLLLVGLVLMINSAFAFWVPDVDDILAACGWKQIASNKQIKEISAGRGGTVYGIGTDNNIYQLSADESTWINYQSSGWSKISVSSATKVYAVGKIPDGQSNAGIWEIKPDYQFASLQGTDVSVGIDGTVWAVDGNTIKKKTGEDAWDTVNGALKQIDVADAQHIVGTNADDKVFARNTIQDNWHQLPGRLSEISITDDGTVVGFNADGVVFKLNKVIEEASNSWSQLCYPSKAISISVVNMSSIYMVGEYNKVYKSTKTLTSPTITDSYSCVWKTVATNDAFTIIYCDYESWGTYGVPILCGFTPINIYLYGFCQSGCSPDSTGCPSGWSQYGNTQCGQSQNSNHLCYKSDPMAGSMGNGGDWKMNKFMKEISFDHDKTKPLNVYHNEYNDNLDHNWNDMYYKIKVISVISLAFIGIIWLIYNVYTCFKISKTTPKPKRIEIVYEQN